MKIRKIFSILLVLTMLLSVAGCNTTQKASTDDSTKKEADTNTDTTKDEKTDKEVKDAKEEPVNLIWIQGGQRPKEYDKVMPELNKMTEKDLGITVDIKYYEDNQKTLLAMSSGEYCDIVFTCEWYNNYALGAQKNYFKDITDKVQSVTPDLYKFIPEVVWNGSKVHNKLFAVPVFKDSAATQYWCFDKKLVVDDCGMDLSQVNFDLKSLEPIVKAVKAKKPDEYPLMFDQNGLNGFGNQYEPILRDLWISIPYEGNSTKVVSLFEEPVLVDDFRTLHEWFKAGYINPDAAQIKQEQEYSPIWTGQGFVGADAIWSASKGHEVAIVKKYGPIYSTASIRGAMNAVSSTSKHVDEALKYLEYANLNKDYRNMLAYGLEGVHYEKTDEGTVKVLNDGYQPWTFSQATFFTMMPTSPAPVNQWELVQKDIQDAPGSAIIGFTPKIDDIDTEIAACTNVVDKYKYGLLTGTIDPDKEIPNLMKELEAVGYRDIMEEVQKQVDEFVAEKNK